MSLHERISAQDKTEIGSERKFGYTIAIALTIFGGIAVYHGSHGWPAWFIVAALLALFARLAPAVLRPLNRIWFWIGLLLHKIVSPVVMTLLFFGAFLPVGLLMRAFGHRPLQTNYDTDAGSYWGKRSETPSSMMKQY